MILSFSTVNLSPFFGATTPLPAVIAAAAAAGYEHVGLDVWSVEAYVEAGGSLEDVARMVAGAGLAVTDVLPLVIGADQRTLVDEAHRIARLAELTGASVCLVAANNEADLAAKATRTAIDDAVGILYRAGVRAAFEWVSYSALNTVAQAVELAACVGWERAGLCVDSWHTFAGVQHLGVLPSGSVALVQFNDGVLPSSADPMTAGRHHRLLPGRGGFDLVGFVDTVRATGFDGVVSPEVLSDEMRAHDPDVFAGALRAATLPYWT